MFSRSHATTGKPSVTSSSRPSWTRAAALVAGLVLGAVPALAAAGPDTSLRDIQHKGTLVIGTDIPYGVMEFYDDSGKAVGIDMDIGRALAGRIDVTIEIKAMPFNELFDSVKSGAVDVVISAVTITPERQQEMLFSVPYLDAGISIAVREDNTEIRSREDLAGKKVGVLAGTVGEELAASSQFIDRSLLRSFASNEVRLQALRDGKLDAILVHFLAKDLPSIKLVGEPLSHSYYGIVTKKGNESLMGEINKGLRQMKRSGELGEVRRKYLGANDAS